MLHSLALKDRTLLCAVAFIRHPGSSLNLLDKMASQIIIFCTVVLLKFAVKMETCDKYSGEFIYVPNLPNDQFKKLGDFNIGVLIPVHIRSTTSFCGPHVRDLGVLQRLEGIVYAIEEINNDPSILPNQKLGYIILDDCYTDMTALSQSLHFSRTTPMDKENCFEEDKHSHETCSDQPLEIFDVVGVIGSESSITTLQSANLLTAFQIPQISYMATTPTLSNMAKFPLFKRTVPSDTTQARVILQLLQRFEWTFIYVMYSEGAYGEGLFRALERMIDDDDIERDICFAEPIIIRQDFTQHDYETAVWNMLYDRLANVTLIIAPEFEAKLIMKAARRMVVEGRFTWIASDAWARTIHSLDDCADEAHGMISINIHSSSVQRFDTHFQQMDVHSSNLNPWIDDFLGHHFECSVTSNDSMSFCDDGLKFKDHTSYHPESTTSLVFDAVKTFAKGLKSQVDTKCQNVTQQELLACVKQNLSEALHKVAFIGEAGDIVGFDAKGDRTTDYNIYNVQKCNGCELGYELVEIGKWNQYTQMLDIDTDKMEWARGYKPYSNCSRPCGVGEAMQLQQKTCCWACVACLDDQRTFIRPVNVKTCTSCSPGKWPDPETRTTCLDIIPHYISFHETMGITLTSLSMLGIILSLTVTTVYMVNNGHQLIKACSRELSYFMLLGITTSYAFVFTLLVEPTEAVCFVSQFGVVTAFTMVYAPLTIKTIRIWRIFEAGRALNRKPRCVTWSSQLAMTTVTVLMHAAMVVIWAVFDPPMPDQVSSGPGQIDLICRFPYTPFITSMSINIALLLICSVFAFKTRKLPDNFNESRFISFCAFGTVMLWLAFILSYFLTESLYRALFIALMLCANGFIFHGGLFIPKIYAIYFLEKKEMHVGMNHFAGGMLTMGEEASQTSNVGHFTEGNAVIGPFEGPTSVTEEHSVEADRNKKESSSDSSAGNATTSTTVIHSVTSILNLFARGKVAPSLNRNETSI